MISIKRKKLIKKEKPKQVVGLVYIYNKIFVNEE